MRRFFCGVLMVAFILTAARTAGAQTATITGTITDPNGLPIRPGSSTSRVFARIGTIGAGGFIQEVRSAEADATGAYTLSGVTPGTYYLYTGNSSQYVNETWDGYACVGTCDAADASATVTLVAGQTLVVNFALDPTAAIVGRVVDAITRVPLPDVNMTLYHVRQGSIGSATTDVNGVYRFPASFSLAIAGSSYYVVANPSSFTPYLGQAYPRMTCSPACRLNDVTPIRVAPAQTVSGIDFLLERTGAVTGRVTDAATGAPLHATVFARKADGTGRQVSTLQDGTYNISLLPPGEYFVFTATAFTPAAGYVGQAHGGLAMPHCLADGPSTQCRVDYMSSTPVTVTAATPTEGIDFRLARGGTIAGRVSIGGQPVDANLSIYDASGTLLSVVRSGVDGNYEVHGLAAGTYFVGGGQSGPTRRLGCEGSSCIPTAGMPVVVTAGGRTAGVDIDLSRRGTIRGVVTNSATGAPLRPALFLFDGAASVRQASVETDGSFTISNVAPGVYQLRASLTGFVDEWYDNVCAACGDRGNPVVVTADGTTTANFALDPGGRISGTITLGVTPLRNSAGVFVEAVRPDGTVIATVAPTFDSVNGTAIYTIDGLPTGSYYVRGGSRPQRSFKCCFVFGGEYALELFNGVDCDGADCALASATSVSVAAGATTAGIDLVLDPAATVEAHVVPEGAAIYPSFFGSPFFAPRVEAYTPDGRLAGTGRREFLLSTATIVGLRPGRFFFKAFGPPGYADQIYKDLTCPGCAPEAGTPVTVTAERPTRLVFTLQPAGSLSGTVRDDADGRPLAAVSVSAFTESGALAETTTTSVRGRFVLTRLPAGRYFVGTSNVMGYADEVYDNAICGTCDPLRGRLIDVNGGAETGGIDFALNRGVLLSGRVTDAAGIGAGPAIVSIFNAAGTLVARATSTATGEYAVSAPAGSSFARLEPLPNLAARLYAGMPCPGGTCDPTSGTPIAGAAGDLIRGIDFTTPVCAPVFLSPASLPAGHTGTSYSVAVIASGSGPYTYARQSGTLPAGLTIEPGTGRIAGTPGASGRFAFVVGGADANGCGTSRAYTLDVTTCTPAIPAGSLGSRTFDIPGGGGTFSLTLDSSCPAPIAYNVPWLSRNRDLGPGLLEVAVAPNPAGRRTGTVTIGNVTWTINQAAVAESAPFGSFDTPSDGATVSGSVAVGGWVLDDLRVSTVTLFRSPVGAEIEPVFIGTATLVPGARPDVERLYPEYPYANRAGWGYLLLTNMLPNRGNGTFTITAFALDTQGNRISLGSRTIVANNATATQPFGAIDTPQQGETISGASFVNFGWALTPQPKTIPKDGSTVTVFIDGAAVGNASYNHYREDIATLFPGLNNTDGGVGFRMLDTTTLADGLHTISWLVSDDSGAATGIGSRYFTVANGNAQFTSGMLTPPALRTEPASASLQQVFARQLEPIEIDLSFGESASCRGVFRGVERIAAEQRALPVGSTLDRERGLFRWQPGPGFAGTYHLSFDVGQCDGRVIRIDVNVTIAR